MVVDRVQDTTHVMHRTREGLLVVVIVVVQLFRTLAGPCSAAVRSGPSSIRRAVVDVFADLVFFGGKQAQVIAGWRVAQSVVDGVANGGVAVLPACGSQQRSSSTLGGVAATSVITASTTTALVAAAARAVAA